MPFGIKFVKSLDSPLSMRLAGCAEFIVFGSCLLTTKPESCRL